MMVPELLFSGIEFRVRVVALRAGRYRNFSTRF